MSMFSRSMRKLSKTRSTRKADSKNVVDAENSISVLDQTQKGGPRPHSPPDSLDSWNEPDTISNLPTATQPQTMSWPTGDPLNPTGFINFTWSPPPSPPLSPVRDASSPPLGRCSRRSLSPNKRDSKALAAIGDWFQGESAPISLGIMPSPNKPECSDQRSGDNTVGSTDQWPSLIKRRSVLTTRPGSPVKFSQEGSTAGPLSLLSSYLNPTRTASPGRTQHDVPEAQDPLLDMDIAQALQLDPENPLSPTSVNNILRKADDLFSQLQAAYRERIAAAKQAEAEVTAQREEAEEEKIRVQHLKQQLDDLSTKLAEQDTIVEDLVRCLAEERRARQEENDSRLRSVRLIDASSSQQQTKRTDSRQSLGSAFSDSGFESNDETASTTSDDHEGPWSAPVSNSNSSCSSPQIGCARQTSIKRASASIIHYESVRPMHQKSLSADTNSTPQPIRAEPEREDCANCQSLSAFSATVSTSNLQNENAYLQQRNKFLEDELDAVQAMIDGLIMQVPLSTAPNNDAIAI